MSDEKDRLFTIFVGQFVSLIVKNMRGSGRSKINNLALAGYLLDECPKFYYIGESPIEVTAAIDKNSVAAVMLASDSEVEIIPEGTDVQ